jgi:molybdate transport system substrate-binding protein
VVSRGLAHGEPAIFARNSIVVIVPRENPARIARIQDLARPGVKLVLTAAAIPAGTYSRDVLGKLAGAPGFPPDFRERVLANVVSHEETVRSTAMKVQLGEGDAAMVYQSDVTPALAPLVRVFDIPEEFNVIARYPVARLRDAAAPREAQLFIDLLLSPDGQSVLRRHGLIPGVSTP